MAGNRLRRSARIDLAAASAASRRRQRGARLWPEPASRMWQATELSCASSAESRASARADRLGEGAAGAEAAAGGRIDRIRRIAGSGGLDPASRRHQREASSARV